MTLRNASKQEEKRDVNLFLKRVEGEVFVICQSVTSCLISFTSLPFPLSLFLSLAILIYSYSLGKSKKKLFLCDFAFALLCTFLKSEINKDK